MKKLKSIIWKLTSAQGLACLFLLIWGQCAFAQSNLPVVRASSKTVDIRDGNHFKKGYWAIMPDRKPDRYYVEIPQKNNIVTFITDLDSISFNLSYGKEYDFIILLNGKDSCYTRISARYKSLDAGKRKNSVTAADTIPFTLGGNRKIYVNAILNGAAVTNIQLDLGAGGTVINQTSIRKVKMNFDKKVSLANSDGVNQVQSASKNLLQIGNLVWDSLEIAVAKNMKDHEDLIIGNSLFKNRILEINYDRKVLVVHDHLPANMAYYSRHEMILDGGVIPNVKVDFTIRNKTQKGWVMFDTGAGTSILNSADAPMTYRIENELAGMVGLDKFISPKLIIGNYQLTGFNYKTRDMGNDKGLSMLLGSDLLRRFNLILDNKNGYMYMQPNSLTDVSYGKPDVYYVVRIVVGLILLLVGAVIYLKLRKN